MSTGSSLYSINGEEPKIVGEQCTGFCLQHFYEDGQITDQVNVAYLRFRDQWHRLYFECATVFWRVSEAPAAAENSGLAHGLLLNDLSAMGAVVGHTLESLDYVGSEVGDVEVLLHFSSGQRLRFFHSVETDSTSVAA
jgi:hypothetical protein